MTVAGIKEGNRNLALDAATSELIADIEQMKNNALSGLHEDVNTAQLSWGVELRPNQGSYKICSDKSKTTENDFICGTGDTLTTKTLPYGIVIQTYDPWGSALYLNFASSTGKFYVNSQPAQSTVMATLRDSVTGNTKPIYINREGLITGNALPFIRLIQFQPRYRDLTIATSTTMFSGRAIDIYTTGEDAERSKFEYIRAYNETSGSIEIKSDSKPFIFCKAGEYYGPRHQCPKNLRSLPGIIQGTFRHSMYQPPSVGTYRIRFEAKTVDGEITQKFLIIIVS